MIRLLIPLVLLSAAACENRANVGIYEIDSGEQILVTNGTKAYFGSSAVPDRKTVLRDYGGPIQNLSTQEVRCEVVSGLTFAVSNKTRFACNGLQFEIVNVQPSKVIIKASCRGFQNGKCNPNFDGAADLEYRYEYRNDIGIEWIGFFDSGTAGDVLRHQSGLRILG